MTWCLKPGDSETWEWSHVHVGIESHAKHMFCFLFCRQDELDAPLRWRKRLAKSTPREERHGRAARVKSKKIFNWHISFFFLSNRTTLFIEVQQAAVKSAQPLVHCCYSAMLCLGMIWFFTWSDILVFFSAASVLRRARNRAQPSQESRASSSLWARFCLVRHV